MSSNEIDADAGVQLGEVTITRVLRAPRELAFRAFFDPLQLARFWGPTGTHSPSERIVVEPWVGGRFETVMVADDGSGEFATRASYVEITEPERFAFAEEGGMLTTSTFTDLGDGRTELVIHQVNVPAAYLSAQAQAGFNTSLDRFEQYLEQVQA